MSIILDVDYETRGTVDFAKFNTLLRRNLMKTMVVCGNKTIRRMRVIIRRGNYAKNNPPWKAAKGGRKSLYHTGYLTMAMKSKVEKGENNVFVITKVGWLDNSPHERRPSSLGMQDIIRFLTNEQTWEPSPASRKAFWAKVPSRWKRNNVMEYRPQWKSPRRDFMADVYNDNAISSNFVLYTHKAIERTFRGK